MVYPRKIPVWVLVNHLICFAVVSIPALVFKLAGSPTLRGFYCDDSSIRYPIHDSTIPTFVVAIYGVVIPSIVILILEYFNVKRKMIIWNRVSVSGKVVPEYFVHIYRIIGIFWFGAAASHVLTETAKYTIGRLRPHFWDVCKPGNVCDDDPKSYIEDFVCQGEDTNLIREARLSFMSGHASMSAYTMLFFALYLQFRLKYVGVTTIRMLLQYGCILLSVYTCFTRVTNNQHHPGDVLTGFVQGTIMALVTFYLSKIYVVKTKREDDNDGELEHIIQSNA